MPARRRLRSLTAALQPAAAKSWAKSVTDAPTEAGAPTLLALTVISAAELARHNKASDCWIASGGRVFDLTAFAESHPGGARALVRFAGTDATDALNEIHTPAILRKFVQEFFIGVLEGAEHLAELQPPPPSEELPLAAFINGALDSAFPHSRFESTGLEAFRFQWAALEHLLRADEGPSQDALDTRFAHRQKSYVDTLDNYDRDWLHVGAPEHYVPQMNIRKQLLLSEESKQMCYVSDADLIGSSVAVGGERGDSREAQREVLGQILAWLPIRYPRRFTVEGEPFSKEAVVHTTTPGYENTFAAADFWEEALMLCALIVQEDMYILREEDANTPLDHTPPAGGLPTTLEHHLEDHPSGFHHLFVSGASTFSFDAVPKFMQVSQRPATT